MSSTSSSTFAEVIQLLAGLYQEHHQALLDMQMPLSRHNKRTASFFGAGWTGRFGLGEYHLPRPCHVGDMPLNKMGPQDDPEAFIDLFEKTAEACGWPQTNWPVRLIPLLSGEAQIAAQQLPVQNLLVYNDLK